VAGKAPKGNEVLELLADVLLSWNLNKQPFNVLEHLSCFQTSVLSNGFLFNTLSCKHTKKVFGLFNGIIKEDSSSKSMLGSGSIKIKSPLE
jgi:hypothetical protein